MDTLINCLVALFFIQTPIEPATIPATVNALATVVQQEYFDAAMANQVAARLKQSLADGKYASHRTAETLGLALTREMQEVTHDKHLAMGLNPPKTDAAKPAPTISADEARALDVRRSNAGVRAIQILPGNIGLLDLSFFYRPEEATETLANAMHLLRNADALILDMRANGGGSPPTVALFISYFLDEPDTLLFDIAHRTDPTDHYRLAPASLANRNSKRPMYVLTSAKTFSGGEGLAFLLQEKHRAEVIGETTAGAANAGKAYPVNEIFNVAVPNGQLKSAVSEGNWEGKGVTPDVPTPAGSALNVALGRALRRLIDQQPPGNWRDILERILRAIPAQ